MRSSATQLDFPDVVGASSATLVGRGEVHDAKQKDRSADGSEGSARRRATATVDLYPRFLTNILSMVPPVTSITQGDLFV